MGGGLGKGAPGAAGRVPDAHVSYHKGKVVTNSLVSIYKKKLHHVEVLAGTKLFTIYSLTIKQTHIVNTDKMRCLVIPHSSANHCDGWYVSVVLLQKYINLYFFAVLKWGLFYKVVGDWS